MGREYRSNDLYIVELYEEEWYGPCADRDSITEGYRERARNAACLHVAVFVTPDPVFPLYGYTKRHRVYEYRFPNAGKPFKVNAVFTGEIDPEVYAKLDEIGKGAILRKVRDEVNQYAKGVAGRYYIKSGDRTLETGRV